MCILCAALCEGHVIYVHQGQKQVQNSTFTIIGITILGINVGNDMA